MKNFNSDSSSALSRFAKDKRLRTERTPRPERTTSSRPERTPRPERTKRASFNPNFTDDNRPKRGVESGERGERKQFGSKPGARKPFGAARPERTERPERTFKGRGEGFKKGEGFKGGRKPMGKSEGYKGKGKPTAERSYPKYNPNKVTGEIRLNRFVAQSGLCSRREADEFIAAGLVSVNGVIVTELGTKVLPTDVVKFNDERLQGEKNVYLVLNKPKGYVTTLEDDHAEKTVMELVQNACKERIYPVGRLDKNSLGLLLFTNDGDITRQLTHPSLRKKKIYEVTLDKPLTRADFEQLAEGITLEDGDIFFDEISYIKEDKKSVGVEIHSGRNRIVRRMFEHLGYKVTKLDRVYYAGLTKKNLKRGAWRFLTSDEVARLKAGRYE
ncbi:MAG: rRNA pseudouridine synthase [Alistipes sp.]|nr:rRNA pseudouridine synthase [Alistipes sp.]